jgi:hypothetical protein
MPFTRSEKEFEMATSEECNQAWKNGYIAGYQSIKGRIIPPIPCRPGTYPPSVNPIQYFHSLGFAAGVAKAGG